MGVGETTMATFTTTSKKYPNQWADGKTWFNVINPLSASLIKEAYEGFELTQFYTDTQKAYLERKATYVWAKCFISAKDCEQIIKNTPLADCVEHYAFITHDCDVDDDGNPKPRHTHILIKFFSAERIQSRLVEYFHVDHVSDCRYKLEHCVAYLTHNSDACKKAKKHLYSEELVYSDNFEFWKSAISERSTSDVAVSLVEDILQGKKQRELLQKYGREFVVNRKAYMSLAGDIAHQEQIQTYGQYDVYYDEDKAILYYDKATGELRKIVKNYNNIEDKVISWGLQ